MAYILRLPLSDASEYIVRRLPHLPIGSLCATIWCVAKCALRATSAVGALRVERNVPRFRTANVVKNRTSTNPCSP